MTHHAINSCQLWLCYHFHNIGKWPLFQNNLGEPVPKSLEVKLFWILMRQTMTGFGDGSGISQTIYKQFALCSNQVTMPTHHHPIFTIRISSWRPTTMFTEGNCNDIRKKTSHYTNTICMYHQQIKYANMVAPEVQCLDQRTPPSVEKCRWVQTSLHPCTWLAREDRTRTWHRLTVAVQGCRPQSCDQAKRSACTDTRRYTHRVTKYVTK